MRRYPHLMDRRGHFYFRIIIPADLIAVFHRREVVVSLQTKDLIEAKARCALCVQIMSQVFLSAYDNPHEANSALHDAIKSLPFKKDFPRHRKAMQRFQDKREESENQAMLAYVLKSYTQECLDNRPKTLAKKQATYDLWLDAFGDMPIKDLGKAEAREFKQLLLKLPANLNKRYKGVSLHNINFAAIPHSQKLSIKSINHKIAHMLTFINWAIQNGHYEVANPFGGLALKDTVRTEEKRHSFSEHQLKAIFNTPIYKGCLSTKKHDRFVIGKVVVEDSYYWVPLIALYSGARMQEICQLYVQDIKLSEDIWYFDFNADGDDKSLKNISSKRKTPVHSELIRMGLLNYIREKRDNVETRLFPDVPLACDGTYSNIFSKKFNYFLTRFDIKTDRTSFHSFRHTFIDALREANVPREVRQALVGHLNTRSAHDS